MYVRKRRKRVELKCSKKIMTENFPNTRISNIQIQEDE